MKNMSKVIVILILLISTTVIILMSTGSFGISNRATKKSEAVELSKAVAEIFASVNTDNEFIEILDKTWDVEIKENIIISDDGKTCFVNIKEEKTDEGIIRYADIEVFVGGESTFDLRTSKYVSNEKD